MSNNKDVIILTYSLKNRLFWADIQFTNDSEQKTKLPTGTKYEKNHACLSLTKQSYDLLTHTVRAKKVRPQARGHNFVKS